MSYVPSEGGEGVQPQRTGLHPTGKQIVSAVLIGLVVLFGLVNLEETRVDFVVTSVRTPLVFVILLSAVLGIGAGWYLAHHREERRRERRKD